MTQESILKHAGGREGYRKRTEERLTQGASEPIWAALKWSAILGGERFAKEMRARARIRRETQGRRTLRQEVAWEEIVKAVEQVQGRPWESFFNQHGDGGRDLALWLARTRGGLTLRELGEKAGGLDYSAVSEAVRRFERKQRQSTPVRAALRRVLEMLNLET